MPTRRPGIRWTKEAIANAIARWHRQHGCPPTAKDWISAGEHHPTNQTVRRVFGDWHLALEAAAIVEPSLSQHLTEQIGTALVTSASGRVPKRRPGIHWTPELISYAIRIWYRRHNHLPSRTDWLYADEDHPAQITVRRTFGSWGAALDYARPRINNPQIERLSA